MLTASDLCVECESTANCAWRLSSSSICCVDAWAMHRCMLHESKALVVSA
jgi:hypothetical protein